MVKIIDISPLISEDTPVWPGDHSFRKTRHACVLDGDSVTLHAIQSTLYIGAHADAEAHFAATGRDISEVDLSAYLGLCQAIDVSTGPGECISPTALQELIAAPRLLLRTISFEPTKPYVTNFARFPWSLSVHWQTGSPVVRFSGQFSVHDTME